MNLDDIRARAEAATEGPWGWWNLEGADQGWDNNGPDLEHVTNEWKTCQYFCTWKDGDSRHRGEVGRPGHEHRVTTDVVGAWGHDAWGINVEPADAEFIAHARTDIPRLLAALEAVIEYVDQCGLYPIHVDEIRAEIQKALEGGAA